MTSKPIIRSTASQVKDAISGVSASHGADVIGVVWYDEGFAGGASLHCSGWDDETRENDEQADNQ